MSLGAARRGVPFKLDSAADDVLVILHSHLLRGRALYQRQIGLLLCERLLGVRWRREEESLVGLVEGVHDQEDGPRGAEEEGDDGHEADLGQGRGEGEAEDEVRHPRVLDRRLKADGDDLRPA